MMQLRVKRSQGRGLFGGLIFCIDAKVYLTDQEKSDVQKYHLGKQVIYNSERSKKYLNKVTLDTLPIGGVAQQMKGAVKACGHLTMAAFSLNVRINDH